MVIVLGAVVELQLAIIALGVQELLQVQMLLRSPMGDYMAIEEQLAHRTVLAHLGVVLGLAHTLQPVDLDRLELFGDPGLLTQQSGPHAVALLDALLHDPVGTTRNMVLERGRIVHMLIAHVTIKVLVRYLVVLRTLRLLLLLLLLLAVVSCIARVSLLIVCSLLVAVCGKIIKKLTQKKKIS